jgi:thioredoxin-like negative regulator of GroEL
LAREVFPQESFKQMSKYFVFVKINGDEQPGLMTKYGVRGYPTIKFMRADGSVNHEFVGFRPLNEFIAEMNRARGA